MSAAPNTPPAPAPLYVVDGPMRAQDGRTVWAVVRPIEGTWRSTQVGESLTQAGAQRWADRLNTEALHGLETAL